MRIDSKNGMDGLFEAVRKQKSPLSPKDAAAPLLREGEVVVDRVELSKKAANCDPLTSHCREIADEIERGTSPDRIRSLKALIESGEYKISSRDIANAMLSIRLRDKE